MSAVLFGRLAPLTTMHWFCKWACERQVCMVHVWWWWWWWALWSVEQNNPVVELYLICQVLCSLRKAIPAAGLTAKWGGRRSAPRRRQRPPRHQRHAGRASEPGHRP